MMINIDEEKCKGCGLCIEACPFDNLRVSLVSNKKGYYPPFDRGERCNGCNKCFMICPDVAIEVYKDCIQNTLGF